MAKSPDEGVITVIPITCFYIHNIIRHKSSFFSFSIQSNPDFTLTLTSYTRFLMEGKIPLPNPEGGHNPSAQNYLKNLQLIKVTSRHLSSNTNQIKAINSTTATSDKMFAVPGWSVDSSALKTQKAPEQPTPKTGDAKNDEEGAITSSSKKRKRNGLAKEVNKDNLADMWERVIEGKPKQKKVKKEKKLEAAMVGGEDETKSAVVGEEEKSAAAAAGSEERVKKEKKKKNKKGSPSTEALDKAEEESKPDITAPPPATKTKLTPLQASMRQKLISARFRHLNQTLYTTPSAKSLSLFEENPEMFSEYHEGFRRQVEVWPENPVDGYLHAIQARGKARGQPAKGTEDAILPLPRTANICNIADLGCGDAALAAALQPHLKKLGIKIHSFDLQSPSPLVTRADIANLPLGEGSVDVAIFCLALMGTNWVDFIEEAYRILRWKGELWIAEIKSRFGRVGKGGNRVVEHSVGNRKKTNAVENKEAKKAKKRKEDEFDDEVAAVEVDGQAKGEETDVGAFVEVLRKRGFVLKGEGQPGKKEEGVDLRNRMFVKMQFIKGTTPVKGKGVPVPKGMGEATGQQTWKPKPKAKFVEEEDEVVGSEAAVLKPCVYKLR